ncbi:hypothetical protein DRN69_07070, partial [Candidatus Pacearchaeota archaeon]
MEIIWIVLILLLISAVSAVCFYIFVYPELKIKDSFKLIVTAAALNKLLFTGSGYLTSSYLSRNKDLSFYKALSAFLLLEALGVSLWIGMGVYFGVKLVIKVPSIIILVLAFLLLLMLWLQRQKFIKAAKNILMTFKNMGKRVPLIIPLIILNMVLSIAYYFLLFRIFNFHPGFLSIIKIISISFTVGYLSPAPAGLGFKDTGMVLLLVNSGLKLNTAISLAILDRVIVTVFWAILGSIFSYDLIKEEIKRRFK